MIKDILNRYLESIDVEQVKDIKDDKVLEVKVHQGYYATIQRYIEHSKRITLTELHRILSLYSIDNIPSVQEIIDTTIRISIVPQATISLTLTNLIPSIVSVPQATVTLLRPIEVTGVPQATIDLIFNIPVISNVPQGVIDLSFPLNITSVPQATVELIGNETYLITSVPQGYIVSLQEGKAIVSVPQGTIELVNTSSGSGEFFWGFTPYATSYTRDNYVAYMQSAGILDLMLQTQNYGSEGFLQKDVMPLDLVGDGMYMEQWDKNIPVGETAYMVFLYPATALHAKTWTNSFGTGAIGGVLNESISGNHWPNVDTLVTYNNEDYYLFVGNRRRRNSGLTVIYA